MSGETMYDIQLWAYNHDLWTTPPVAEAIYHNTSGGPGISAQQVQSEQGAGTSFADIVAGTAIDTSASVVDTTAEIAKSGEQLIIIMFILVLIFVYFYLKHGRKF